MASFDLQYNGKLFQGKETCHARRHTFTGSKQTVSGKIMLEDQTLELIVSAKSTISVWSSCNTLSSRIHSLYQRTLADLTSTDRKEFQMGKAVEMKSQFKKIYANGSPKKLLFMTGEWTQRQFFAGDRLDLHSLLLGGTIRQ